MKESALITSRLYLAPAFFGCSSAKWFHRHDEDASNRAVWCSLIDLASRAVRLLLCLASIVGLAKDIPATPPLGTVTKTTISTTLSEFSGRVPLSAFGAVCDGKRHPLSERYTSLAEARAVYPGVTSLDDETDTAALAAWLAYLDGTTAGGRKTARPGWIGQGTCMVDRTLYLPLGVDIQGAGRSQSTARGGTDLQRSEGMVGDIFRVIPFTDKSNGVKWWDGKIAGLRIINTDPLAESGNGINLVDAEGNPVRAQNNTVFEDVIVRGMPENGFRFPIGGIATYFSRTELFHNKLNGIFWSGRADAILFSGISGDANGDSVLKFENVEPDSGSILIESLKSEENINHTFSIHGRNTPILINSDRESASFIINGVSHIRADRNKNGQGIMPGSAIVYQGRIMPDIVYQGVKIRVRKGDVGETPYSLEAIYLSPEIMNVFTMSRAVIG